MDIIPSLKQKLNNQFKLVAKIRDEKELHKNVKDLMSMMISPVFQFTCIYPSNYKYIDSAKMHAIYGLHMAVKIQELADVYKQDKQSEFVKIFLALCMEYFNLTQTTTKREKIQIRKRIDRMTDNIRTLQIKHNQWSAGIAITLLKNHAISALTDAFIASML